MNENLLREFEEVRKSGETNMIDYLKIIEIAHRERFHSLAALSRDEYFRFLDEYRDYRTSRDRFIWYPEDLERIESEDEPE